MINIKTRSFVNKRLIKQKIRNLAMLTHVYYTLLTKTKQNDNNFATTSIHGTTIFSQNRNIIFFVRREREKERPRSFDTEMVNTVTLFNIWMLKRFEWEARSPLTAPEGKLHAAVENFEHGKV